MLFALLTAAADAANTSSPDSTSTGGCFSKENLPTTLLFLGLLAIFVVWMYFSNKKRAKQQQEIIDRHNAIKPGNKVMTIGGITGTVVEVCPEDNTFVLETGNDANGKSYLRFDKKAIYETDAVAEQPVEPVDEVAETPAAEPVDEQADELFDEENKPAAEEVEETVEESTEEVVEETEEEKTDEE